MAWETCDAEISVVLARHGLDDDATNDVSQSIIVDNMDRIRRAAKQHTNLESQRTAMLDEIEKILIENEILKDAK